MKDATLDWPERQRTGFLRGLAQDQISGTVPGGVLAIAVIERAVGTLSLNSQLVVLPDAPGLQRWRKAFAGKIGVLEPRPQDAENGLDIAGDREIVDSKVLFERLLSDPKSRVDAAAFLTARLVDLLVGDWDRYEGQWLWARFDEPGSGAHRWVPIPTDRDWAFNRLDGAGGKLLRLAQPKFQKFDGQMRGWRGLLIRPEPLDRRILISLTRSSWDSLVSRFVARVDDRTIHTAIAALPPGFDPETSKWLELALQQRRAILPTVASAWYAQLAGVVDVWATEASDHISLETPADGSLTVRIRRGGERMYWTRRFFPSETREVRVYSLGGTDTLAGRTGASPIKVRFIDGGGGPLSVLPAVAGVRIYDSTRKFNSPVKPFNPEIIFRDWGSSVGLVPWIDYRWQTGLVLGGGTSLTRYGFRKAPYASRMTARLAYTTGFSGINAEVTGDFRRESSSHRIEVLGSAYTSDAIGYFGLGDTTSLSEPTNFYVERRQLYRVEPRLVLGIGNHATLSIGSVLRHSATAEGRSTLATLEQPYGVGSFTEFGGSTTAQFEHLDHPVYPLWGAAVRLQAEYFPAIADVTTGFGTVGAEIKGFATAQFLPVKPTLAVRMAGSRAWGSTPFFEAPALGGIASIRGLLPRRFIGTAALSGSAELRLDFGGFKLLVPGDWGAYALGDAGRIDRDDGEAGRWHRGWGGGLWFALFDRKTTLTVTYARSEGSRRVYVYHGFHF